MTPVEVIHEHPTYRRTYGHCKAVETSPNRNGMRTFFLILEGDIENGERPWKLKCRAGYKDGRIRR
jgi:hypothetical protein